MDDTNLLENQPIAWTPTPDVIDRAQLTRFMKQVGVETWDELYEFSIRDVEKFTEEVLKFLDIKFDPPYSKFLDTSNGLRCQHGFAATGRTASDSECPRRRPEHHRNVPRPLADGRDERPAGSDLGRRRRRKTGSICDVRLRNSKES